MIIVQIRQKTIEIGGTADQPSCMLSRSNNTIDGQLHGDAGVSHTTTTLNGNSSQFINRLHIFDRKDNTKFLINTGADIPVLPPTTAERRKTPTNQHPLYAANGTEIKTIGTERIQSKATCVCAGSSSGNFTLRM